MPRQMPRFDLRFASQANAANEIVIAGELTHVHSQMGREWPRKRLEFLYELAFLRIFAAWESTLESIFLKSLCGYASSAGQELTVTGSYYRTIVQAEAAVLLAESRGNVSRTYLLWQNTRQVLTRCRAHITSGGAAGALQENIIASNQARLDDFAAIRHRIVHEHSDARAKFDRATLSLAGRTFPASRPGKFLRDDHPTFSPPVRWIDVAISELTGLTGQMV